MDHEAQDALKSALAGMRDVNQAIAQATKDDEMIVDIAKQVGPALAAVLCVIWFFMRHLQSREEGARVERAERDALFLASLKEHGEEFTRTAAVCHEVQGRALDSIDKNTEALVGLKTSQEATEITLREVRGALAWCERRNSPGGA